jgi:putative endopeptidase
MRSRSRQILLSLCVCCALVAGAYRLVSGPALNSGIDRTTFDMSVRPGENFFQYVNGGWIRNNPIPSAYGTWGTPEQLYCKSVVALNEIVEGLGNQTGPLDPDCRKLRDFYKTATDQPQLEAAGASPLAARLERVAKIKSREELIAELARFHLVFNPALFQFSVAPDQKQSTRYAIYLSQGGLGLPDRDLYLGKTKDSQRIRDEYSNHVAALLGLLGDSPQAAKTGANSVLRIETRLAEACQTPVQLRDREANYNKLTLKELARLTPHFDWNVYWRTIDAGRPADVIVGRPEFFQRADQLVASVPVDEWRTYLRWHLVHSMAPYLSLAFEDENFRFYRGVLRGANLSQRGAKPAANSIDQWMGDALGRLYVEKHFTPAAKERMEHLVKNLLAAFRERIQSRDWMSPETKKQALAKLAALTVKIGYPEKWRDYSALDIRLDSYAENVLRAQEFEMRRRIARLDKPVDRTEWLRSPATFDAYYQATMNEIVFPAGVLQPPLFEANADDAVNYGAIGTMIGHEITHGFDDQGSRFDADGNLHNWWSSEDRARFRARADKLIQQYDECVVVDDLHINGRLTLGENLADLGGVAIAYAAYQKSLDSRPAPVIDGFTGPQRFFIGFAKVWCGATRDAELRLNLRTDPHSPLRFRATVPLSNVDAFYEAFDVKPGDAMYRKPQDRVEVW